MPSSPLDAQPDSEADREARREAELRGDPYLLWYDGSGRQQIFSLAEEWDRATIGRGLMSDICLNWDEELSRVHAQLELLTEDWALVDDGLSRNGSFVNGERVEGRRLLSDGDELRFGDTVVVFRHPFEVREDTVVSSRR